MGPSGNVIVNAPVTHAQASGRYGSFEWARSQWEININKSPLESDSTASGAGFHPIQRHHTDNDGDSDTNVAPSENDFAPLKLPGNNTHAVAADVSKTTTAGPTVTQDPIDAAGGSSEDDEYPDVHLDLTDEVSPRRHTAVARP
eukprot:GFYU01042559.1.p1 GENE.GFYU01042559.1~~GFYU01042559.1.p1  ORF type:complete len:144 (-),score=34.04 GFYU01042559.1:308-739(-)